MTKQLLISKRPFALKLIVAVFVLLPLAGLFFRLPPPVLLALFVVAGLIAFGLYNYKRYAYWLAVAVLGFAILVGLGVTVVTLSLSHPEGYPEALLFLALLVMIASALVYLLRRNIRVLFLSID